MNEEFKCSKIRGGLLTNSNLSVSFFKVITIIYENMYDGVCRPTSVHVFLTQNKETIAVKWTKTRLLLVNVRMRMNWERRLIGTWLEHHTKLQSGNIWRSISVWMTTYKQIESILSCSGLRVCIFSPTYWMAVSPSEGKRSAIWIMIQVDLCQLRDVS